VCQSYAFYPAPENVLSYFGSFSLQVWPAAALNLSGTGGPPGTTLTAMGSGFSGGETVVIYFDHIGGVPSATITADASGGFTVKARESQAPCGPIDIYAVGLDGGKLGASSFFVTAAIAAVPSTGVPGETIIAPALGFGAGETIDVYWSQPRQRLGSAVAKERGTGSLTFPIPANAPSGPNALLGIGQTTGARGFGGVLVK
jgi:hypothetical protein